MIVSLIVACGPNGEIGRRGTLPWPYLRPDMQRFVEQTRDKPVIMGRATWDSLPNKPLLGRQNIVLSRDPAGFLPSIRACDRSARHRVDVAVTPIHALALAAAFVADTRPAEPETDYEDEVVVIGGAHAYSTFLPMADRVYLTKVEIPGAGGYDFPSCDRYFGYPLSPREWSERQATPKLSVVNGHRMGFFTFTRIAGKADAPVTPQLPRQTAVR